MAVDSSFADVRRSALAVLCQQSVKHPELMNHLISSALTARLTQEKMSQAKDTPADDHESANNKIESRLCAVYLSCGVFGDDLPQARREPLLVNLVVLGHHPTIGACFTLSCPHAI